MCVERFELFEPIELLVGGKEEVLQAMAGTVYDVVVVGAGNAGLCAALAARQAGARVLLLDKCPKSVRGGNTAAATRDFQGADFALPITASTT
jgi:NADPH-dependent 2,4-dienoyl-CoA reductase/sulfur reductase-like enzyme